MQIGENFISILNPAKWIYIDYELWLVVSWCTFTLKPDMFMCIKIFMTCKTEDELRTCLRYVNDAENLTSPLGL